MTRGRPPFFLAGGEIALFLIGLRVAIWVLCGWRASEARAPVPPDPDGPGGRPLRIPRRAPPARRRGAPRRAA